MNYIEDLENNYYDLEERITKLERKTFYWDIGAIIGVIVCIGGLIEIIKSGF